MVKAAGDIYQQLGQRIREIRLNLGYTQEAIAFRADINPSFLSYIERGSKKASLDTIARIAAALGVPVAQLLQSSGQGTTYGPTAEEDLFLREMKGILRDRDDELRQVFRKAANYLARKRPRDKKGK